MELEDCGDGFEVDAVNGPGVNRIIEIGVGIESGVGVREAVGFEFLEGAADDLRLSKGIGLGSEVTTRLWTGD